MELKKIEKIIIKGQQGRDLLADLTFPKGKTEMPVVVFCHGFKGFKDWGHFNLMAEEFAHKGFAFLKFNFSHNGGTVDEPIDFPDLKAFGENDFLKELSDIKAVVNAIENPIANQIIHGSQDFLEVQKTFNKSKISLIAHSRGGGIAAIYAAEDPRVKKLVLWASISDFGARQPSDQVMSLWKENGVLYIENTRTKQQMPMNYSFVEVFEKNRSRLNIKKACLRLKQPVLVVQGLADEVVKADEAHQLIEWLGTPHSLLIENSDHVFGSQHPYHGVSLPGETKLVIETSMEFLNQ